MPGGLIVPVLAGTVPITGAGERGPGLGDEIMRHSSLVADPSGVPSS